MFRLLHKSKSNRFKSFILNIRMTTPIQCYRYKSHYASLGLDSSASQKDIKSAYYQLSLQFHPDKNDGSPESIEKFREIAEAYEVLGNPDKKRAYDRDFGMGYSSGYNRESYPGYGNTYKPPRSGRDQFYNYEEHIRKHYEKFYREKQAEHEQFRRRWEADRREYDREHWSNYRRPYPPPPQMQFREAFRSKTFVYGITFWILVFLICLRNDADKVKPKGPIYYDVKERNKTVYYATKNSVKEE